MLSCDVTTDLMPVYESGEASAETRRLIEEHLAGCAACRRAFDKGARVESALSRAGEPRDERPVNGQKFVSRTRRLFFFIGVGVLLLFAAHAAIVMRVFTGAVGRGVAGPMGLTPGLPHGLFPVAGGLVPAVAVGAGIAYIVLVLSRGRESRGPGSGDVARAIAGGFLLTVLALATLYVWVVGPFVPGLIASLLLLGALGVTVTRLARLPYFTIATIVSLCVALFLLLNVVAVTLVIGRL